MLAIKNAPIIPPSTKLLKKKEPVNPSHKNYAQIALSGLRKIATNKAWTKITGSSHRQKVTTPNVPNVEQEKRRIIFHQKTLLSQKSEADLMLALNKSLQKTKIPAYIWFSRVSYLQFRAISTLLTEKSCAKQLVNNHLNIIIRATKIINMRVIGVEALER